MITINEIVDILDKISNGTGFSFDVLKEENEEVELCAHGYNPEGEDWSFDIVIETPETEEDLIKSLCKEFWDLYNNYDIEENVYMWLEAKKTEHLAFLEWLILYIMKNIRKRH